MIAFMTTVTIYSREGLCSSKIYTRLLFVCNCSLASRRPLCMQNIQRYPLWAFGILPVGMVMFAQAVEHDEVAFSDLSVAVPWR